MKFEFLYAFAAVSVVFLVGMAVLKYGLMYYLKEKEETILEIREFERKYRKYFRNWRYSEQVYCGTMDLLGYSVVVTKDFRGFKDYEEATPFLANKSSIERRALWEEMKRELDWRAEFFKA